LTENQQNRVAMIAEDNNRLYRAYRMKEMLRLLLKIKDTDEAGDALKR
ncbi:MAG: transposase, partial [Ruminobacter sp.]|nr:transposase [Ruminobacter sp.]